MSEFEGCIPKKWEADDSLSETRRTERQAKEDLLEKR
jgi:hypothetical protein